MDVAKKAATRPDASKLSAHMLPRLSRVFPTSPLHVHSTSLTSDATFIASSDLQMICAVADVPHFLDTTF